MAELPYCPVHVGDMRTLAGDLSNDELGIFWRLWLLLWERGRRLHDRPQLLAKVLHVRPSSVERVLQRLVDHAGLVRRDGVIHFPRLDRMWMLAEQRRASYARRANIRWGTEVIVHDERRISAPHCEKLPAKPLESFNRPDAEHMPSRCNHNQNPFITSSEQGAAREAARVAPLKEARRRKTVDAALLSHKLYVNGAARLIERTECTAGAARQRINGWLADLDDADLLLSLIDSVYEEGMLGHAFGRLIDERVMLMKRERTRGLALPLPPVTAFARGGGRR